MTILQQCRRVAHERVGRRGAALLCFALTDVIYGMSLISANGMQQNATVKWFSTLGPLWLWFSLWISVAVVCAIAAFSNQRDLYGFISAIGIKVWWSLMCLVGWIAGEMTLGAVGVWAGLAVLVALIAGWPEPDAYGENES